MMIRDDSDENGRGYKKYELAPVMVTDAPYLAVIGKIIDFRFLTHAGEKVSNFRLGKFVKVGSFEEPNEAVEINNTIFKVIPDPMRPCRTFF